MSKNSRSYSQVSLISHLFVGGVGALAMLPLPSWNFLLTLTIATTMTAFAAFLASRYTQRHIRAGLELVENAVVNCEKTAGDSEFHQAAHNVVTHVTRLAAVAAKGREQSREVETVLAAFDRRVARDLQSSPARQLSLLLTSLGSDAQKYIDRISLLGSEMQDLRAQMLTAAEDENELVRAAASEVNELATGIAETTNHAKLARSSDISTNGETESAYGHMLTLQQQLETLREQVGNCDKKSLSLRDQTVEIASLMQTIHEYSSKTDTMALNASIESVRAGEHGRHFAAAADEIRKLTSIISDSTRDAIDRLKIVEGSVDDTTSICSQGNATIEEQMATARDLSRALSGIRQSANQSREHIDEVLETTESQLQNLNVVAGALGGIFESAELTTARTEQERRNQQELDDELFALSGLLLPLTGSQQKQSEPDFASSAYADGTASSEMEHALAHS